MNKYQKQQQNYKKNQPQKKKNKILQPENETLFQKVISFPEKINHLAIMLFSIAYLILLLAIFFVSNPVRKYYDLPNYKHELFTENLNYYTVVMLSPQLGNVNKKDKDGNLVKDEKGNIVTEEKMLLKYSIRSRYASTVLNPTEGASNLIESHAALYGENVLKRYMHNPIGGKSNSNLLAPDTTVAGDSVKKVYLKYYYKLNNKQYISAREETMFTLSKKELNDAKYHDKLDESLFKLDVKFIERKPDEKDAYYDETFTLKINDRKQHHLDYQMWIVSEDNDIYPYLGIYGGETAEGSYELNNSTYLKLFKYVKPKDVYMRINFYDENKNLTTFYYKVPFNTLVE